MKTSIFASDWSGVINDNHFIVDGSENSILNPDPEAEGYLTVQPVENALKALTRISEIGYVVHIVSRIDPGDLIESRVRRWLCYHGFERAVPQRRVHFCQQWHEKADICRRIEPRCFVDDRLEVLQHLVELVPHLFVFRPRLTDSEEQPLAHLLHTGKVTRVDGWTSLVGSLPSA